MKIARKEVIFYIPILYYLLLIRWLVSAEQVNVERVFTALSILPLVIIALFQEEFKRWWFAPRLKIDLKLALPYCSITPFFAAWEEVIFPGQLKVPKKIDTEAYYFRFKVINLGKSQAKNCEVVMTRLMQEDKGKFYDVKHFQPVDIKWDVKSTDLYMNINPSPVGAYTRLGYISKEFQSDFFHLEYCYTIGGYQPTTLRKNTRYRFTIGVVSENAKYFEETAEFFWDGGWGDTEKEMFKHIDFKLI